VSTAERDAQTLDLRQRIVEAARDIVSEEGLDGLSMRALGVRIGYSPATIYHHFHDKDELLRSVMAEGFKRLGETVAQEMARQADVEDGGTSMSRLCATGRAYARFGLENTGYFRAMFRVPGVASMQGCPEPRRGEGEESTLGCCPVDRTLAVDGLELPNPERAGVVGWGLMHGLTSLYLSGHLAGHVGSHEEFMELIESAIDVLRAGWKAG